MLDKNVNHTTDKNAEQKQKPVCVCIKILDTPV